MAFGISTDKVIGCSECIMRIMVGLRVYAGRQMANMSSQGGKTT